MVQNKQKEMVEIEWNEMRCEMPFLVLLLLEMWVSERLTAHDFVKET